MTKDATFRHLKASLEYELEIIIAMTRRITVGGVIFNVEPVGYEILKEYLKAWNQISPSKREQWEVLAAEYLLQQLNGGNSVTTRSHVERMNKKLSEVPFPKVNTSRRGVGWGPYFAQLAFSLW